MIYETIAVCFLIRVYSVSSVVNKNEIPLVARAERSCRELAAQFKLPPLLAQCLLNRGFSEPPPLKIFSSRASKNLATLFCSQHGRLPSGDVPRPRTK